jgi:pimeloyl-ACP methyl ester carboxylesterase
MPAFFLHGVPDTAHLWDDVRAHLQRKDVVAPSMPGFDTPLPDGFDCTKDAYASWLVARVEEAGAPVDIVGHDWGAMLVQRLVSQRPDLVRTWAVGSGPLDTEYEWHPTAKTWQTPGAGEQLMAALTPDAVVGAWKAQGITDEVARAVASRLDDRMKSSILTLYRSATRVAQDWPPLTSSSTPGLVIWGNHDPYVGPEFGRRLAERTGARFIGFEGCGHWWPYQRAAEVAALLEEHWAR